MSTASRSEVEQLHRSMMQSSVDAAALERRAREAEQDDGLQDLLGDWTDAAQAISAAFDRARAQLQRDGNSSERISRVEECVTFLKASVRAFEIGDGLDECVGRFQALSRELGQLTGEQREALLRLLSRLQPQIDRATAGLSQAQRNDGLAPEKCRIARDLRGKADGARDKYERLREQYLAAERDCRVALAEKRVAGREAELARAQLQATQQQQVLDWRYPGSAGRGVPAIARLPDPRQADLSQSSMQGSTQRAARPGSPLPGSAATPPALPKLLALSTPNILSGQPQQNARAAPFDSRTRPDRVLPLERNAQSRPVPSHRDLLSASSLPGGRAQTSLQADRLERSSPPRPSGPLRVSVERIERVSGFPTAVDGIGRGQQTANIFFRAENFDGGLAVGSPHGISLGASCRLDVAPLVALFSSVPGTPQRGKLSLGLSSSGGRLVGVKPADAHAAALSQARGAAEAVAAKVGPLGRELTTAIRSVLEDAADKIFARAQPGAVQQRLPANYAAKQIGSKVRGASPTKQQDRHLGQNFDHALGEILSAARESKAPGSQHRGRGQPPGMHHLVEHEPHHQVASKLERTLSHLATATHRVLTDSHAGELRGQLARLDALLAGLKGKTGHDLVDASRAIGQVLSQMGGVVSSQGGAAHIASFRGLLGERRAQLAQIAGAARKQVGAEVARKTGGAASFQMPSVQVLGEKALESLRNQSPGVEKLLRSASHAQLARVLGRRSAGGLEEIFGRRSSNEPRQKTGQAHALFGVGLGGIGGALGGGGHLGGFGSGPGGSAGALARVFSSELEQQARRGSPQDLARIVRSAPKGSPLRLLAQQADDTSRRLAANQAGLGGRQPANFTAQALLGAFKARGRGDFAAHVAPGGELYQVCSSTQRSRGQPLSVAASHYLQARGGQSLWNAVSTFHGLVEEGHKPRFSLLSSARDRASSAVSGVANVLSQNVSRVTALASAATGNLSEGLSSLGPGARGAVRSVVDRGVGLRTGLIRGGGESLHAMGDRLRVGKDHLQQGSGRLVGDLRQGLSNFDGGAGLLGERLRDRTSGIRDSAVAAMRRGTGALAGLRADGSRSNPAWAQRTAGGGGAGHDGTRARSGLEWVNKTGVAGAVGTGLRSGMHLLGHRAGPSPLGSAARSGWGAGKSALSQIWDRTRGAAGAAWGGAQGASRGAAGLLQSPAGQFTSTGLSLAACFIPGGLLVRSLAGAAIGAIQAVSDGKDAKSFLPAAGAGAIAGVLPFLKIGPLAKVSAGALTGAVSSLAAGGNFREGLTSSAGSALNAFEPGALKQLSLSAARKLLEGKKLGKLEKLAMEGGQLGGPLRALEKALKNPKVRRTINGLEKAGKHLDQGNLYLGGQATKIEGALKRALGLGEKVEGSLGKLERGTTAGLEGAMPGEDGLHYIGGKKSGHALEKLRTGPDELPRAGRRGQGGVRGRAAARSLPTAGRGDRALDRSLSKGKGLRSGEKMTFSQFLHDRSGKLHELAEKGLLGARAASLSLQGATLLAQKGADSLGEESELGHYLLEVSERAEQLHGYVETGIERAEQYNGVLGKLHGGSSFLPGVHDEKRAPEPSGEGRAARGAGHGPGQVHHLGVQGKKGSRGHSATESPSLAEKNLPRLAESEAGKAERLQKARVHAAAEESRGAEREPAHGLKALEMFKRRALKLGRLEGGRLRGLARTELHLGLAAGRGSALGLAQLGSIADQLVASLGEDSPLAQLTDRQGGRLGAQSSKLRLALGLGKGKAGAGKGRDLLDELLGKAAAEHQRKEPGTQHHRGHGPLPTEQIFEHHGATGGSVRRGNEARIHLPHFQVPVRIQHLFGLGQPAPGGAPAPAGGVDDPAAVIREAAQAVQGFGEAVSQAVGQVEQLMHAKKSKEAGDKLQAISGVSETTRVKVMSAVASAASQPALQKQAAALKAHYLEIRAHLFKFIHALHGLAGDRGGGVDAGRTPDLHAVAVAIDSLGMKVSALGDLQHADSHMQAPVRALQTEEAALQKRLDQLRGKHASDKATGAIVDSLASKLGRLQRMLSGHRDPANLAKGNRGLDVKPPATPGLPRRKNRIGPRSHDYLTDLLGPGAEGRIFIDRGGNRGEADHTDGQEIDSDAVDTWLGAGEGTKLFSEVFSAFLPAEGSLKGGSIEQHQAGAGGGDQEDPHFAHHGVPENGARHGGGEAEGPGGEVPSHRDLPQRRGRGRRGQRKGQQKQGGSGRGFFHGLFEQLEQFADHITQAAQSGEKLLGKGMHYAEEGIHGLRMVEGAAERVHEFAGVAEGFLGKHHFGRAASFAHQIGAAAGAVDDDAKWLQGGLTSADQWMGRGKKELGAVESLGRTASGAFQQLEQGQLGGLLTLFRSSRSGDGIDGKGQPDQVRLGSNFDEPRRIDGGTLSKMENFLDGDFAHVRIHTGPGAGIITRKFDAEAVTVKDHIFFAPGRFNTQSVEGQKLLAHELTHVKQMGRANLDVRTAEGEALQAEHSFGAPEMETLNLSQPQADFKLADGEGLGASTGIHTAKRSRSRGHETGGKDELPDGDEFLERVSDRVYHLLLEELEEGFESR